MKRLTFALLALCLASPVYAWMGMAAGHGVVPTVGAGPSYLIQQDFEGAGYDNVGGLGGTWTADNAAVDPDYATTPAPIVGSQSLYLPACTSAVDMSTYVPFTLVADNVAYTYWRMIHDNTSGFGNGTVNIATIRNGTGSMAMAYINTAAGHVYLQVRAAGGTLQTLATNIDTFITNRTPFHIWFSYTAGTGANAKATLGYSSDGTRPTSGGTYAESTDGTQTSVGNRLYLGGDNYGSATVCGNDIYDHARVRDAQIGNSP